MEWNGITKVDLSPLLKPPLLQRQTEQAHLSDVDKCMFHLFCVEI